MKWTLLLLLLLPAYGWSQTNGDCTIDERLLGPVIRPDNPFFTDHTFDSDTKMETARLDEHHTLTISQSACIRHHMTLTLLLDPKAMTNSAEDTFWTMETLVMLKRVFFDNPEYLSYKKEFETHFVEQFIQYGTEREINFPVNERSFICNFLQGPWGGKIELQIIRFQITGQIKKPGIPREKDDGWFVGK